MNNAAETVIVATDNSESHAGEPPDSSERRASRRVFPFRYSLAIASTIVICYALVMFILRDDPEATVAFTDLALIPINGMAALALLYAAASSYQQRKKVYLTWLILSLATFSFTMGDVIWAYEETILKVDPFFSHLKRLLSGILSSISMGDLRPPLFGIILKREIQDGPGFRNSNVCRDNHILELHNQSSCSGISKLRPFHIANLYHLSSRGSDLALLCPGASLQEDSGQ